MDTSPQSPSNRRHRAKRLSLLRLSTDTTSSLPAYSAPPAPRPPPASHWPDDTDPPLDEPPDYPQSAEEADREDDFVPLPPPSRIRKPRHRRSESLTLPITTSVDDLLERSVVALELSTSALLQSMNTQSTISSIANDQILERSLERQAILLDMRLKDNRNTHEGWMDDLNDVMNRMDGLVLNSPDVQSDGISRSLPTDSLPMARPRKQNSLGISPDQPYLHLTTSSEIDLRDSIRPPRALTQYVSVESSLGDTSELTADARSILLPSTTGLRAAAQLRSFSARGSSPPPLRKALSSPGPERSPTTSTSAYNFLSKLVSGQCSPPPSRTRTSTPSSPEHKSRHGGRRHSASSADGAYAPSGLRRTRSTSRSRSSASSETTIVPPPPPVRAMTPPLEETTPSSSESEQNVQAFRAMQSLRKILDDAPDPKGKRPELPAKPARRTFYPRSTPVAPSSGTSMATASVYRLLTKSSHHPSASRPKQSSLKKRPQPSDSLTAPETPHPESQRSSAPSTPRQVSFADLPAEFPGRSWRNKDKGRSRSKGKGKKSKDREHEESPGWWKWFMTPSTLNPSPGAYEDRLEDKMMKGWGKPSSGGGSVDDWIL